jgi:hypothetical protein
VQKDEIVTQLQAMLENPDLITEPGFRANAEQWPNHSIPFVENHVDYLSTHKNVNPTYYLSNLKLQLLRRKQF